MDPDAAAAYDRKLIGDDPRWKKCPDCGGRVYEYDDGCQECAIRKAKTAEMEKALMGERTAAAGYRRSRSGTKKVRYRPKKVRTARSRAFKGIVGAR